MTDGETFRHQCEVRQLLAWRVQRGREWLRSHLDAVEKVRGKDARARLEADILQQWTLGNRGEPRVWLAPDVAKTAQASRMEHHG